MKKLILAALSVFYLCVMQMLSYSSCGETLPLWASKYSGSAGKSDMATAMVIDGDYIYITGFAVENNFLAIGTSREIVTVKYNKNTGAEVWSARFGSDSKSDSATSIAVICDEVYVTGVSFNGTDYDCVTIKYNSSGVQQWAATYDNGYNDVARSIVLSNCSDDDAGGVFICGWSEQATNNPDYITIKYDRSSGSEIWAKRYNGKGNSLDHAYDLVLDNMNNVYVTGYATGSGYVVLSDAVTIKYGGVAGSVIWAKAYSGDSTYDWGTRIVLDDSMNVYIGGATGGGDLEDILAVKYDSTGTQIWASTYDGSSGAGKDVVFDMAVDEYHNVYVTGPSMSGSFQVTFDYATVKFNISGVQQWAQRYNGSGNTLDFPHSLKLDDSRNVYVTGWTGNGATCKNDYVTIKYDDNGNQQWINIHNECDAEDSSTVVALDDEGNVYVTGGSAGNGTQDMTTIKINNTILDNNLSTVWVARYDGNFADQSLDITVDGSGNVYVTGWSVGSSSGRDYKTIKYDPSGTEVWNAAYNNSNYNDSAVAIFVDGSGNVYVTGQSMSASNGYDCVTIKYNSAGAQQWAARYDGSSHLNDRGSSVWVSSSGAVYVTGTTKHVTKDNDFLTIKYDAGGNQQWAVTRNDSDGNTQDELWDIAGDSFHNVYVTGGAYQNGTVYTAAVTIKYDSSGNELWLNEYNGTNSYDETYSLVLDDSNNVYVTGITAVNIDTTADYLTIKYNSSGTQKWVATYNGTGNRYDAANDIAVDAAHNVYITGQSQGGIHTPMDFYSFDYATIKYNITGGQQWVSRYNGPLDNADVAAGIKVDEYGNSYVTGYSRRNGVQLIDYATIKYDASGDEQWVQLYNYCNADDSANAIAIYNSEFIYVTGVSKHDFATISYLTGESGDNLFTSPVKTDYTKPREFMLFQNYPNPFNPVTNIKYQTPLNGNVTLIVYDLLGREVARLVNGAYQQAGVHSAVFDGTNLASGVYFYNLIFENGTTRYEKPMKMVLIK